MIEPMHRRNTPIFVLLNGGEVTFMSRDRGDVLTEARCAVDVHITNHLLHDLPVTLDDEDIRWIDVEVHELSGNSQIALPYQQWAYDYWVEVKEAERFKALREKYEGRFQKELAGTK